MATATTPTPVIDQPSTPPAPRHGIWYDDWEPYEPRKSDTLSTKRSERRTPSPSAIRPAMHRKARANQTNSGMSPRKKRQPVADSVRRASGQLTADSTASAGAALGLQTKKSPPSTKAKAAQSSLLLTPKETPQKPATQSTNKEIGNLARNLFGGSDNESSTTATGPRAKKSKKYSGLTMESFTAETIEDPFDIFTDSNDRFPQKDNSLANPFYGETNSSSAPTKRRSQRKVKVPGVGMMTTDEAARREDGSVWNFRGKPHFRFEAEDDDVPMAAEGNTDVEAHLAQPLRRSDIKPRILFPTSQKKPTVEDEEAFTDIEDHAMAEPDSQQETPKKARGKRASTPDAPKHAPMSPPTTRRVTRMMNKLDDETAKPEQKGLYQFFSTRSRDSSKGREQTDASGKRHVESLAADQPKRARI